MNPRRASGPVVSTERLIQRGCASPWVRPGTRSRSLPGESVPLTHVDLHGHLSPGVGGCQAAERPHGHRAEPEWDAGRCRTLCAGDVIVARLAVSRFCLQGTALQRNLLASFGSGSKFFFRISWSFINTLTFWPTSWFAVFYRVKVASFSHPIFFWLKCRISRSVPGLLLGSLTLSGLTSSAATEKSILVQMVATQGSHGNDTLTQLSCGQFHSSCSWCPPSRSCSRCTGTWGR